MRVLLVEDDRAVAQMYQLKLELDGWEVELVGDGVMAVEVAIRSPPDIVLLDIHLPGLGGIQVLERLRTCSPTRDVPVIVLSNSLPQEKMEQASELGIGGWLLKSATTPAALSKFLASCEPARVPAAV